MPNYHEKFERIDKVNYVYDRMSDEERPDTISPQVEECVVEEEEEDDE